MPPICPTHGVDHGDPKELEKQRRTYKRRLVLCTALYLSSVVLGWSGLYLLLGLGGLALGVAVFFIHFGQLNMRLNGALLEEITADLRQREFMVAHPDASATPAPGKGTYL